MQDRGTLTDARILVVDDEQANVLLVERILQRAGYTNVVSTTDPTHAGQLETASPPADQHLAAHILRNHPDALKSWEVAFIRSMAGVSGDLSAQQAAGLGLIWRRIQGGGRCA